MRILLTAALALALSACSDVPDRDEVKTVFEVSFSGIFDGLLRMQGHEGDDEQVREDVDTIVDAMVECMYENTDVEGVNWDAVSEVTGVLNDYYEDNPEDVNQARANPNLENLMQGLGLEQAIRARYDGELPPEDEMKQYKEGMEDFGKWLQANQDCEKAKEVRDRVLSG